MLPLCSACGLSISRNFIDKLLAFITINLYCIYIYNAKI